MIVTMEMLFPSDDLVAQWVYSLTAAVDDISIADGQLHDSFAARDASAVHAFRLLVTRLYEAERLILILPQREEIRSFLDSIPQAQEPLGRLVAAYGEDGDVPTIRGELGLIRHRSVHYSWVGSPELAELLHEARDVQPRYVEDDEAGTGYFEWPRRAFARAVWGDLADSENMARLKAHADLAHGVSQTFKDLLFAVMQPYVTDRRGIRGADLVHKVDDIDPEI